MKRNATFYKETYNLPYQPSLLLASCVYSTIHVKEFASVKEQKISSESNSPFSKFSSFREHEGFKISNLEWIQKVFKQIKSIYPIGDRVLQSHLLKLFERSGQTLIKSPIELDFFQHPLRCSRCVASETDIVSLTLSEALRIMQEEASSLFEPSGGKEDIKVIPKKDSKLSGATLIGILSGDFNGKLVIMDRGQQILVTESSGLIQTYHLGHIWLISDFELVYKREVSKACPSYKCQIRISLEKCVCIYLNLQPVKPPQYIIQIRRIDHRDRFLEVKALVLQFAQNRDPLAEESKRALFTGLILAQKIWSHLAQILKDLRELSFGPTVLQADQSLIEDWQSMNSEFQKKSLICQSSMDVLGKKDKNLGILKTRAETLYLFEYYHQRVPLEKVFRVFCKIGYVYKAILRYDCRKCERALSSHHSFQPCFGASSPTLYTYLKCRVNDGTYQAIAIFKDSNVFKALEIDNDLQKILRSEAKSRDFVYSSSSNIVVTDFDRCCVNLTKGFRNVVLFCRRSSSDEEELPSDAPISEYSRIQVGPRTSHYWTLMANNLFLEVVDIERLSVTGEAWSLVRNLEDDG
ncbi:hypothetical protein G9A89_005161 [Geosiphon pyriformis]|nr:hypothetical protein G9A89_005161 [Geosiphon pyriformis]